MYAVAFTRAEDQVGFLKLFLQNRGVNLSLSRIFSVALRVLSSA